MNDSERPGRQARTWPYVVAGVIFAGIIGWISYTDALAVTTLAGNGGGIAYAYPVIPDGLLFFSLLAAWEAARDRVPRSRWAVAGLVLGAGMTLAANTGAGLQRSVLDAVIDFLIPVCFFVAVEIVLWHVRRGRDGAGASVPVTSEPVRVTEGRPPSAWLDDQILVLLARMSARSTAEALGVSKTRVETAKRRAALGVPQDVPAGVAPDPHGAQPQLPGAPAGAHLNGDGTRV